MTDKTYRFMLSPLDEQRFGVVTARVNGITADHLAEVLERCKLERVIFLIARCSAADFRTVHAMERTGFLLMDTLVYWKRDLRKTPIPPDSNDILVRPARVDEAEQVKSVARDAFRGYFGHYHADERLDRVKCDETYASWAERSVLLGEVADTVLVAQLNDEIVGFATLRMNNSDEGEGVLYGVSSSAQGRGIYRSLIVRSLEWCAAQGASWMAVSTQLTNVAVQKVWARVGFEFNHAYYTFHKWLDE